MDNGTSQRVKSYIDAYIKEIEQRANEAYQKAVELTYKDYISHLDDVVHKIFKSAIDTFYGSFSPMFYDRSESLYNLLKTVPGESTLRVWFEPSDMTGFRNGYHGEDGLYDQVFRKGWHGGAAKGDYTKSRTGEKIYTPHPDPGTPYWRTPYPYFSHWGNSAPIQSVPPLEEIKRSISDYCKSESSKDINLIWNIHKKDIKIEW